MLILISVILYIATFTIIGYLLGVVESYVTGETKMRETWVGLVIAMCIALNVIAVIWILYDIRANMIREAVCDVCGHITYKTYHNDLKVCKSCYKQYDIKTEYDIIYAQEVRKINDEKETLKAQCRVKALRNATKILDQCKGEV